MLRLRTSLGIIAAFALLWIGAGFACADTVVLKNGSSFTGLVTLNGDSYTIQTKFGSFSVAADQVSEWRKDNNNGSSKDPQPGQPPKPVAPTDVVLPPPPDLSEIQKKAETALVAGDYKTVIDLLSVPSKNSHDVRLLHALGLACLKQHQANLGMVTLERASTAAGENITRALVINTAAAELQAQYPGRAIKTLYKYVKAHQKDAVDEQVLNALGIALTLADDSTRGSAFFSEAAALYLSCNSTLEATRPGFKRFGQDWFPAEEADRKLKEFNDAVNALLQAQSQANAADQNVTSAQNVLKQSLTNAPGRPDHNLANQAYHNAVDEQHRAYDRMHNCAQAVHSPFPPSFDTVPMDSVVPGSGTASTGDQSHNSTPTPPAPPKDVLKVTPPVVTHKDNPLPPGGNLFQPPAAIKPKPTTVPSPTEYAAAFPVADQLLVTSAAIVTNTKDLTVQGGDGVPIKVTVVRVDKDAGLALIRVTNMRLNYLSLADQFAGGQFDCPGFSQVDLFNPAPAMMPGDAPAPGEHWALNFEKAPKLSGSPLISNGDVVGVEIIAADAKPNEVTGVTLDTLRKFIGDDLPHGPPNNPDPLQVVWQVVANLK